MEITGNISNQYTIKKQLPTIVNSFKANQENSTMQKNLPAIRTVGTSMVNTNLPISYTKLGEIDIPGLKDKASVFKLANGQRVIIAPKKGPTVIKTSYNVGSLNEPDDIRGISHYIEHNLFNGSKNLEPKEYTKQLSDIGGNTNANTSYATTNYFLKVQLLNENSLEDGIRLNSLQTQYPTFPIEQLEKEKEPVKSEIDMYKDMPYDVANSNVIQSLFGIKTNSTNCIIGTKENINAMTREKVLDYYNTWYTPDNAVTVITGDVDVDETMALVSKYYNKPNDYSNINKRYNEAIQYNDSPKRTDIIMPNATTSHISMGFAIPEGTSKEDLDKILVLSELLSSPTSSLSKKLDKLGIRAFFSEEKIQNKPDSARAKTIEINTPEENVEEVLKILYQELANIANNPPSFQELEHIKNRMINEINSTSESSSVLNEQLAEMALNNNYNWFNETTYNIRNITPQDISAAAKKFFDLNKTAICVAHEKTTTATQIQNNYNSQNTTGKNISFGASVNPKREIEEITKKIKQFRLPNNIETTIIPGNANAKSIISIDFQTDALNSVSKSAISVLDRMINRGSAFRNNDIYNSIKTQNDIDIALGIGIDGISIYSEYNDENMKDTLSLIKETLIAPNFTQQEFEQAKKIIREEILYAPIGASDKLNQELFPSIRAYASKEQQLQELDNLTLNDIRNLYSHILSTSKVHASLTANTENKPYLQDIFHNELSYGLGNYKPYTKEKSPEYYIYKPNTEAKILTQADERAQAEIIQAYTFPKSQNIDDMAKIFALENILGGGMSSRLFMDLRETQKLAYSVGASFSCLKNQGMIKLNIGTTTDSPDPKEGSPANITKALDGFERNINQLKNENITPQELEQIKNQLKTEILNIFETNIGKSDFATNKNTAYNMNYYLELFEAIDRLNPDDIKAAANFVFKNPPITSIVASKKTLDALNLN